MKTPQVKALPGMTPLGLTPPPRTTRTVDDVIREINRRIDAAQDARNRWRPGSKGWVVNDHQVATLCALLGWIVSANNYAEPRTGMPLPRQEDGVGRRLGERRTAER